MIYLPELGSLDADVFIAACGMLRDDVQSSTGVFIWGHQALLCVLSQISLEVIEAESWLRFIKR